MSKPLVSCLWGCGESVNPLKLNIQEDDEGFVLLTDGRQPMGHDPKFGREGFSVGREIVSEIIGKKLNINDFLLSWSPTQGKDKKQHTKQENNSLFRYFFLKVHLLCIEISVQTCVLVGMWLLYTSQPAQWHLSSCCYSRQPYPRG